MVLVSSNSINSNTKPNIDIYYMSIFHIWDDI